jgi:hypothetical protein
MLCYVNSMQLLRQEIMLIFKVFLPLVLLLILLFLLGHWKIQQDVVKLFSWSWLKFKGAFIFRRWNKKVHVLITLWYVLDIQHRTSIQSAIYLYIRTIL